MPVRYRHAEAVARDPVPDPSVPISPVPSGGSARSARPACVDAAKAGSSTTHYGYNENNQLCWAGTTDGTAMSQSCPSTPSGNIGHDSDHQACQPSFQKL